MYVVNRKCLVEGVSSEDSAAIAADAIENDKYYKYYTFRNPTNNPFGVITKRLTITDSEGNIRMEGVLTSNKMLIIQKFGICCLSKIIEQLSWLHSIVTVRVSLKM